MTDSAYVIVTRPNCEKQAEFFLLNWGYRVYFPKVLSTIRHARKTTQVERPFLPRYLFVAADKDVATIRNAPGVADFVRVGGGCAIIRQSALEQIRNREVLGMSPTGQPVRYVQLDPKIDENALKSGQSVWLSRGDGVDLSAVFQHAVGENRAMVFVQIFGRMARTVVPLDELRKQA